MKHAVICFTRVPKAGVTKTRLLPLLRLEQCRELHCAFLRDLAGVYATLDADLLVSHTPDPEWKLLQDLLPSAVEFFPQEGDDLGQRMHHAMQRAFALGYERVILTGTDLPTLTVDHLNAAFSALERAQIVLGPTSDGGYYLVGSTRPCPELFQNKVYGTGSVYQDTCQSAVAAGYTVAAAPICDDVDTPDDLRTLQAAPDSHTHRYLTILQQEGILP